MSCIRGSCAATHQGEAWARPEVRSRGRINRAPSCVGKGPELRAQEFFERVGRHGATGGVPRRLDFKRHVRPTQHREVFARVRLDLQPQAHRRRKLRIEAADDLGAIPFRVHSGFAQKSQRSLQSLYRFLDRFSSHLNQIDVLRVAWLRLDLEFVQGSSTAKRQTACEPILREDLGHRTANDQILFHLFLVGPRHVLTPCSDVRLRNHGSGSISRFTTTFHRLPDV